jgi:flagellar basal-body rod modification protein FlgD
MPKIGPPEPMQQSSFEQVKMAPKKAPEAQDVLDKVGARRINSLTPTKEKGRINQDDFLKMLSFQMQHQDPTNPTDSSKFTGELAQYAQLEQLTNINKKMEYISEQSLTQKKLAAASFMGKSVITNGNSLNQSKEGESKKIYFNLDQPASLVRIQLLDQKGNLSGEVVQQNLYPGAQEVLWDGKAMDGYAAPKGIYQVKVMATDSNDQKVAVQTKVAGTVSGVSFDDGEIVFTVDGKKIFLRDVDAFEESKDKVDVHAALDKNALKAYAENQKMVE